jgi:hypothetical protein
MLVKGAAPSRHGMRQGGHLPDGDGLRVRADDHVQYWTQSRARSDDDAVSRCIGEKRKGAGHCNGRGFRQENRNSCRHVSLGSSPRLQPLAQNIHPPARPQCTNGTTRRPSLASPRVQECTSSIYPYPEPSCCSAHGASRILRL